MRLTAFTDYGLRTLIYLACLPPEQLSSVSEVSNTYQVSQNHMVKVVGQLRKLGYIEAYRGKNGGITLAKPAEEICIGEVIVALENHLDGVDCAGTKCRLQPACQLRQALNEGMQAFVDVMNQYSLADVTADKERIKPLLFGA
ncbi:Rrf2 family transcriptional regulator [Neptunomonas marina]|uniref:Rrf2 family transcriptional regulator n=1 Tax=Neptunomonas marina TaxID=1815562 RepID=A0A437Q949_9GAMM|nr:Rrf2 family transcriptional regulator [Neptunomonas marina]RVU31078.1 Rrf2 family transcriptional regulator [Neptunomonas marina]